MAFQSSSLEQGHAVWTPATVLTRLWHKSFGWLVIALLLLLEYGLFHQFATREVTWAYPANADQIVFLGQSYETYEEILDKGLLAGLWLGFNWQAPANTLTHRQASLRDNASTRTTARRSPTGTLIHLQASLLFLLLGPSRLSALTLNFLYFALLQIVLAWTLHWLTRRWSVALAGVGLLLTALAPFYYAGGLMDFRLDFIALCLYGIFLAVVLRSRVFAVRRWSLLAGATAAWLVLFRFITVVYLAGIFGVILPYLAFRLWRSRQDPSARQVEVRRLQGLVLAGMMLILVTVPVLWHHREAIKHYYVIGHLTGVEKHIRAQQFGGDDPYGFYLHSLLIDHAGPLFLQLSALTLGVGLVLGCRRFWRAGHPQNSGVLAMGPACFFVAASLLVPVAILTMNLSRSPVVANIVVPALVLLVLVSVMAWTGWHRPGQKDRLSEYALATLAVVLLGGGMVEQLSQYGRRTPMSRYRADAEQVLQLYDRMGKCCEDFAWKAPRISSNALVDYLIPNVAKVLWYERQGLLCEPQPGLGSNVFAVSAAEALDIGRQSDFVIISRQPVPRASVYPFDKCMLQHTPQLEAFCKRHFTLLQTFHVGDSELTLFVRPTMKIEGDSHGWITSKGLTLRGTGAFLRRHTKIKVQGRTDWKWLDRMPTVRARLVLPGRSPQQIPATLTAHGRDYLIVLDVNDKRVPTEMPVEIHLAFDRYFVPEEHGLGEDPRRLVIQTPELTELVYQ